MPSYLVRHSERDGRSQYQDVCFPVTKEFREKLYEEIMDCYQQEKEKAMNRRMEQVVSQDRRREDCWRDDRELPFR